jgi:hypothetical protein
MALTLYQLELSLGIRAVVVDGIFRVELCRMALLEKRRKNKR